MGDYFLLSFLKYILLKYIFHFLHLDDVSLNILGSDNSLFKMCISVVKNNSLGLKENLPVQSRGNLPLDY